MTVKTMTHNFRYTKEDIANLIKGDIARKLQVETIPNISHRIYFRVGIEDNTDWKTEIPLNIEFKDVIVYVEGHVGTEQAKKV